MLGLDGIAKRGFVFLPGYREDQTWEKVVDDYQNLEELNVEGFLDGTCWNDLGFSESSPCERL